MTTPFRVRAAVAADLSHMWRCDAYAQSHPERRSYLKLAVRRHGCLVAEVQSTVAGFSVLTHEFFGQAFIPLVVVSQEFRRRGIGLALVRATEAGCRTPRLFSSTNASNAPAQALLQRAGFARSGVVENLDAGDPELIFFKEVAQLR